MRNSDLALPTKSISKCRFKNVIFICITIIELLWFCIFLAPCGNEFIIKIIISFLKPRKHCHDLYVREATKEALVRDAQYTAFCAICEESS